jgi:hypothetical protein
MTGVVLRCPNCGTVHPEPGECAACHEAQVRYFCANHNPGVWLDAQACPKCGAHFGDPAPVLQTAPPEPAQEIIRPRRERRGDPRPWGHAAPPREFDGAEEFYPPPAAPDPRRILLDILGAAARGRARRTMSPDYEGAHVRRRGGCIGTLVTLVLLALGLFLLLPVILSIFLGIG